jgi:hypothetical protein
MIMSIGLRIASLAILSVGLAAWASAKPLTATTLVIASISPPSGYVGTPITLTGSGFLADNTILFGAGAILHVPSDDGAKLIFIVPGGLTPACFEQGCRILSQPARPGHYAVSVRNAKGTSNAVPFTLL